MADEPLVSWPRACDSGRCSDDRMAWPGMGGAETAAAMAAFEACSAILVSMLAPPPRRVPPAAGPAPEGAAEEFRRLLARTVEAEVVPRLLLRGRPEQGGSAAEGTAPGPEDVIALVALVMTSDTDCALAFVDLVRARGVPLDRLYLELLAPAARRLGQLWHEDLCSFADVTMGLGRLQQLLRALSPAFVPPPGAARDLRRRAALLPLPGEQHTFGLLMVGEFFLRAGWEVWTEPRTTGEALDALVREQWFGVLGLSLSCDAGLDRLPGLIRSVRRASRNPGLGVMVGGRLLAERPELAAEVGADATALDGRQAALQAETLLALHGGRDMTR